MKILNCENLDRTLASLSSILHLKTETIIRDLLDTDLEKEYTEKTIDEEPSKYLLTCFKKKRQISTEYDGTYWFHITRVKEGTLFKNGILPLGQMLPDIESFIEGLSRGIVPRENQSNHQTPQYADLFSLKTEDSLHWGPFAFLVRETALTKPDINYDYLGKPEIVEDIIRSKYANIQNDLLESFEKNTVPCIVKFKSDDNRPKHLGTSLYYVYLRLKNMQLSTYSNTCYDGEGTPVDPDDICGIEFLYDYCP